MTAKLKFQYFKSYINFFWPSVERIECRNLLASALMNLNRWFRMKKIWTGKLLSSFVIFFPRTSISTGTSWTEPRCCVNSCKITGSNFGNSLYVPICCSCAFLLNYYLNLWKLFSFNNTDRVPGVVTRKENLKNEKWRLARQIWVCRQLGTITPWHAKWPIQLIEVFIQHVPEDDTENSVLIIIMFL